MLIGHNNRDPIFIIGSQVAAVELQLWLKACTTCDVIRIDHDQFATIPKGSHCFLGFWNADYRKKFLESSALTDYHWPSFVHPTACVNDLDSILPGSVIFPMSQIAHRVNSKGFLLLGSMCNIGHGTSLGSNVIISPGVIIGGSTNIGNNVLLGQSSNIKDKITIVDDCKFAINSVVTKDILESGHYYGNKKANIEF
jgi:acetyltransferase-like isoleucine patch superfamily enzyme